MRSPWTISNWTLTLSTGLALTAGSLVGCLVTNQNHCALNQGGGCGEGMMCSNCEIDNNGCVPIDSQLGAGCLFQGDSTGLVQTTTEVPPTTESSTPTDTSEPTVSTFTTEDTETVDPTNDPTTKTSTDSTDTIDETTEAGPCTGDVVGNQACGGTEPYCVDGECVGCTQLSCKDVDPNKPACEKNSGLCVGCLQDSDCKTDENPACNLDKATCEPCSSHEQCPDTACNLETGECFPKEKILYVDNTTSGTEACSDTKHDGTSPTAPICTLGVALTKVAPDDPTTIKISSKPQTKQAVVPPGALIVAIGAYSGQSPVLNPPNLVFPALTVSPGNTVFLNDLQVFNVTPASDPLILCEDATLWIDELRIFRGRTAIRASDCRLHVRQTLITGHTYGGIEVNGSGAGESKLWVENSFITNNKGTKFGALQLGGDTSAAILYSTLAQNTSPTALVECVDWSGNLAVRNSVAIHPGARYGANCPVVDNATNFDSLTADASFDDLFAGQDEGVLFARPNGGLSGLAKWLTGDPRVDYAGAPRPTVNESLDYAGADRPN